MFAFFKIYRIALGNFPDGRFDGFVFAQRFSALFGHKVHGRAFVDNLFRGLKRECRHRVQKHGGNTLNGSAEQYRAEKRKRQEQFFVYKILLDYFKQSLVEHVVPRDGKRHRKEYQLHGIFKKQPRDEKHQRHREFDYALHSLRQRFALFAFFAAVGIARFFVLVVLFQFLFFGQFGRGFRGCFLSTCQVDICLTVAVVEIEFTAVSVGNRHDLRKDVVIARPVVDAIFERHVFLVNFRVENAFKVFYFRTKRLRLIYFFKRVNTFVFFHKSSSCLFSHAGAHAVDT